MSRSDRHGNLLLTRNRSFNVGIACISLNRHRLNLECRYTLKMLKCQRLSSSDNFVHSTFLFILLLRNKSVIWKTLDHWRDHFRFGGFFGTVCRCRLGNSSCCLHHCCKILLWILGYTTWDIYRSFNSFISKCPSFLISSYDIHLRIIFHIMDSGIQSFTYTRKNSHEIFPVAAIEIGEKMSACIGESWVGCLCYGSCYEGIYKEINVSVWHTVSVECPEVRNVHDLTSTVNDVDALIRLTLSIGLQIARKSLLHQSERTNLRLPTVQILCWCVYITIL